MRFIVMLNSLAYREMLSILEYIIITSIYVYCRLYLNCCNGEKDDTT